MTTDNDRPLRDENIPRSARITAETEGSTPRKMASRGHNLQPRGPTQSEGSVIPAPDIERIRQASLHSAMRRGTVSVTMAEGGGECSGKTTLTLETYFRDRSCV